jgi:hypothetical protein
VFIIDSASEKIAYFLGIARTTIDFVPQKAAEFSTSILSLHETFIGNGSTPMCRKEVLQNRRISIAGTRIYLQRDST